MSNLDYVRRRQEFPTKLHFKGQRAERGFDLQINLELPPVDTMRSFWAGFRKFYMPKEPTNVNKVCDCEKTFAKGLYRQAIDRIQEEYIKADNSSALHVTLGGERVTTKEAIDLFFNGEVFHSDPEKVAAIERIEETPAKPIVYYQFVIGTEQLYWHVHNLANVLKNFENDEYLGHTLGLYGEHTLSQKIADTNR